MGGYLENIKSSRDLKRFTVDQLRELASEIRQRIIETLAKNGGHLASNLGVVELTLGIHYVFVYPTGQTYLGCKSPMLHPQAANRPSTPFRYN